MDRHWNVVVSNQAAAMTMSTAAPYLLQPPVNVLRLSLHPEGLAPHILNLGEWRAHLLARLRHQIEITGDAYLAELQRELLDFPASDGGASASLPNELQVVVPLRYASPVGTLNLMSTTLVFGTPLDITLSELALETFFPADAQTAALLRRLAEERSS
jgi:hypothetical protein